MAAFVTRHRQLLKQSMIKVSSEYLNDWKLLTILAKKAP